MFRIPPTEFSSTGFLPPRSHQAPATTYNFRPPVFYLPAPTRGKKIGEASRKSVPPPDLDLPAHLPRTASAHDRPSQQAMHERLPAWPRMLAIPDGPVHASRSLA
jgi:hypothetical protein